MHRTCVKLTDVCLRVSRLPCATELQQRQQQTLRVHWLHCAATLQQQQLSQMVQQQPWMVQLQTLNLL